MWYDLLYNIQKQLYTIYVPIWQLWSRQSTVAGFRFFHIIYSGEFCDLTALERDPVDAKIVIKFIYVLSYTSLFFRNL